MKRKIKIALVVLIVACNSKDKQVWNEKTYDKLVISQEKYNDFVSQTSRLERVDNLIIDFKTRPIFADSILKTIAHLKVTTLSLISPVVIFKKSTDITVNDVQYLYISSDSIDIDGASSKVIFPCLSGVNISSINPFTNNELNDLLNICGKRIKSIIINSPIKILPENITKLSELDYLEIRSDSLLSFNLVFNHSAPNIKTIDLTQTGLAKKAIEEGKNRIKILEDSIEKHNCNACTVRLQLPSRL